MRRRYTSLPLTASLILIGLRPHLRLNSRAGESVGVISVTGADYPAYWKEGLPVSQPDSMGSEQSLLVDQVRSLERLGEPVGYGSKEFVRFLVPSLIAPEAGETCAAAQLKQPGGLPLRERNSVEKACFGAGGIPYDQQQIAPQ